MIVRAALAFAALGVVIVPLLLALALVRAARLGDELLRDPLEEKWELPACEGRTHRRVLR
jgi:hypothetical protein